MRIAIDIDSTLHHYWDMLAAAARRRFGVDLPYDEQLDWAITRLRPDQLAACVAETHSDELIASAVPYPGAVEVISRWSAAGHFIHITSHRVAAAHPSTERWLRSVGLPFDELYCSDDKISRCVEVEIDLLIDDSPVNLLAALEHGIAAATIAHPWNRDVCEDEEIVCADGWPELERRLAPLLAGAVPASSPKRAA